MLGSGRLGFPKVVPVTPPVALTVYRSRQLGPGARPDPATSRLDARAAQSPFALAEQANLPNVLVKDPTGNGSHGVRGALYDHPQTNNDKVLEAHLIKGHGVSQTSWRPLSAS